MLASIPSWGNSNPSAPKPHSPNREPAPVSEDSALETALDGLRKKGVSRGGPAAAAGRQKRVSTCSGLRGVHFLSSA